MDCLGNIRECLRASSHALRSFREGDNCLGSIEVIDSSDGSRIEGIKDRLGDTELFPTSLQALPWECLRASSEALGKETTA